MDLTLRSVTQTMEPSSPKRARVDGFSFAASAGPESHQQLQQPLNLPEFSAEQITDALAQSFDGQIEPLTKNVQPLNVEQMQTSAQLSMLNAPTQSVDTLSTIEKAVAGSVPGQVSQPMSMIEQVDSLRLANQKQLSPSLSLLAQQTHQSPSALTEQTNKHASISAEQVNRSLITGNVGETSSLLSAPPLALKKIAVSKVAMMDSLNPVIPTLLNVSQSSESNAQKIVEWAKVDLASAVNNQQNKAQVSSQIGEKLNAILQDRINIQASNNIKTAQIRLDPPDLGHIKLTVSLEGDRVSVNVSAQNSLVREALMQTSERLRHELVNQNFVNVSVDISSGEQAQAGKKHQQQQQVTDNHFSVDSEQNKQNQDEFIVKV